MVPPADNVFVLLTLVMSKLNDAVTTVTTADAVAVLLPGTGSGKGVTPLGEFSERCTLAVLTNEVEVGVAARSTLIVIVIVNINVNVSAVSGNSALMVQVVQVPVFPDVVNVPAVALGAGLATKASVGGSTSRYRTLNAPRRPLLRATVVKVPVDPANVGVLSALQDLVTAKSALKGAPPLAQPAPSFAAMVAGAPGVPE